MIILRLLITYGILRDHLSALKSASRISEGTSKDNLDLVLSVSVLGSKQNLLNFYNMAFSRLQASVCMAPKDAIVLAIITSSE
jgi:hypothetical protein